MRGGWESPKELTKVGTARPSCYGLHRASIQFDERVGFQGLESLSSINPPIRFTRPIPLRNNLAAAESIKRKWSLPTRAATDAPLVKHAGYPRSSGMARDFTSETKRK
jgi:hypothetical protein